MSLSKQTSVDKIEIVGEFRAVQVRTETAVFEDGEKLSSSYHRHVITAGDDYSGEAAEVKAVCKAVHTQAVKDAYNASLSDV